MSPKRLGCGARYVLHVRNLGNAILTAWVGPGFRCEGRHSNMCFLFLGHVAQLSLFLEHVFSSEECWEARDLVDKHLAALMFSALSCTADAQRHALILYSAALCVLQVCRLNCRLAEGD